MSSNDRQPSRRKKKNSGIPMLIALAVVAVILVVVLIVLITSDGGSKKNSPKGNSKFALKNETYNVEQSPAVSTALILRLRLLTQLRRLLHLRAKALM